MELVIIIKQLNFKICFLVFITLPERHSTASINIYKLKQNHCIAILKLSFTKQLFYIWEF